MNKLSFLLALLLCMPAFAQRDTLWGRVMSGGDEVPGVFVINKNTGAEVKTGSHGLFEIPVRNGDRLVVYSSRTEVREFIAGKEWFAAMPYSLEVEHKAEQLETVVIDKNITPESLGLVPENQKQYTVAERRLYNAAGDKPLWQYALGLLMGSMPLDPFINAISGKNKKMKEAVAQERQMANLEKVQGIFTATQITGYFNIPSEKVGGFLYFAAENPQFIEAVESNNLELARLELSGLAAEYNSLQQQVTVSDSLSKTRPDVNPKIKNE